MGTGSVHLKVVTGPGSFLCSLLPVSHKEMASLDSCVKDSGFVYRQQTGISIQGRWTPEPGCPVFSIQTSVSQPVGRDSLTGVT